MEGGMEGGMGLWHSLALKGGCLAASNARVARKPVFGKPGVTLCCASHMFGSSGILVARLDLLETLSDMDPRLSRPGRPLIGPGSAAFVDVTVVGRDK